MTDSTATRRPLLTFKEVADSLNVSPRTVRRKVDNGELAVVRIGRSIRVHPDDLDVMIAEARHVKDVT